MLEEGIGVRDVLSPQLSCPVDVVEGEMATDGRPVKLMSNNVKRGAT